MMMSQYCYFHQIRLIAMQIQSFALSGEQNENPKYAEYKIQNCACYLACLDTHKARGPSSIYLLAPPVKIYIICVVKGRDGKSKICRRQNTKVSWEEKMNPEYTEYKMWHPKNLVEIFHTRCFQRKSVFIIHVCIVKRGKRESRIYRIQNVAA